MENPILTERTKASLTQVQLADKCHVHWQVIFLLEQGCYPHILPAVAGTLNRMGVDTIQAQRDYFSFVKEKRIASGEQYGLPTMTVDSLGPPVGTNPLLAFRKSLGLSRMAFCKTFCIHPAYELRCEQGKSKTLNDEVDRALRQAGLSDVVLRELNVRVQEDHGMRI